MYILNAKRLGLLFYVVIKHKYLCLMSVCFVSFPFRIVILGTCIGLCLSDCIAEGNLLFSSITTNIFLIVVCLVASCLYFHSK